MKTNLLEGKLAGKKEGKGKKERGEEGTKVGKERKNERKERGKAERKKTVGIFEEVIERHG